MKFYILLFSLLAGFSACTNERTITGHELMPEMALTDSVQIIYFKSPDEQRFFTYANATDKLFIQAFINDLLATTTQEKSCLKEGKIYCYKNGEIFNTVFFAYLDKDCVVLRYIKNGNLFYFEMSDGVKRHLQNYKSTSLEPLSKG